MITSVVISDSNSVFARLWAEVAKDIQRHSAIHLTNEGLVWQLRREVVVACVVHFAIRLCVPFANGWKACALTLLWWFTTYNKLAVFVIWGDWSMSKENAVRGTWWQRCVYEIGRDKRNGAGGHDLTFSAFLRTPQGQLPYPTSRPTEEAVALEQEQRKKRGKIKRSERRAYDKLLRKTFEENAKLAREGDQEAKNKMVGCVAAARLLREQTEENRVAHGQARRD